MPAVDISRLFLIVVPGKAQEPVVGLSAGARNCFAIELPGVRGFVYPVAIRVYALVVNRVPVAEALLCCLVLRRWHKSLACQFDTEV